jgi:hypothetical protein
MPEFVVPEPGEPFQSEQIYAWIERLCVRSYKDLLAPHWNVRDRAVPTERFDPGRYTRKREFKVKTEPKGFRFRAADFGETRPGLTEAVRPVTHERVVQVPARSLREPAAAPRAGRLIDVNRLARPAVTDEVPAHRPALLDRVRQVLAQWARRLHALLGRSRG